MFLEKFAPARDKAPRAQQPCDPESPQARALRFTPARLQALAFPYSSIAVMRYRRMSSRASTTSNPGVESRT